MVASDLEEVLRPRDPPSREDPAAAEEVASSATADPEAWVKERRGDEGQLLQHLSTRLELRTKVEAHLSLSSSCDRFSDLRFDLRLHLDVGIDLGSLLRGLDGKERWEEEERTRERKGKEGRREG